MRRKAEIDLQSLVAKDPFLIAEYRIGEVRLGC